MFTKIYIYLLFRGVLSANGQMTANTSSWDTLRQSTSPLPSYIALLFHGALPPPGYTNTTLQNCCKCLELSREVKLNGKNVTAQFH